MALITAPNIADTSTTTGTGNLTVSGTPPTGFQTFSAVMSVGDTATCFTTHETIPEWEAGVYTYSALNTLERTTIITSSNNGQKVNFSSGTKRVFINESSARIKTVASNFSVVSGDNWIINNKSGATCVVTLPSASGWTGDQILFQNYQAQALDSASSNVIPLGGGSAGASILPATVGKWAILATNGSQWVVMAAN